MNCEPTPSLPLKMTSSGFYPVAASTSQLQQILNTISIQLPLPVYNRSRMCRTSFCYILLQKMPDVYYCGKKTCSTLNGSTILLEHITIAAEETAQERRFVFYVCMSYISDDLDGGGVNVFALATV